MFSWLFKKFRQEAPPVKPVVPQEDQPKALFNQGDILRAHGQTEEAEGLCAPLSNLYAKYRMGVITAKFMEDQEIAYEQAVIEENHQVDLVEAQQDGIHSAFIDTQTPYIVKEVTFSDLSDKDKLEHQLGQGAQHALIHFPVTGKVDHMIYLGRDDKGMGYEYDANRYHQEIQAPVDKIMRFTANFFKEKAAENKAKDREIVTLAVSSRKPQMYLRK